MIKPKLCETIFRVARVMSCPPFHSPLWQPSWPWIPTRPILSGADLVAGFAELRMSISATSGRKWAWRNLASILRFVTMRIRGHRPSESIMTTFMYGWMQLHGQVLCTCLDMFGEFFLGHSSSPYLSPSILRQWLLKALRCFLHGIIDVRYHVIQFMSVGFLVVGIYGICMDMWWVAFLLFLLHVPVCISNCFASTFWSSHKTQESVEYMCRRQGRCLRCQWGESSSIKVTRRGLGCDYSALFELICIGSACFGYLQKPETRMNGGALLDWYEVWFPLCTGHRMDAT